MGCSVATAAVVAKKTDGPGLSSGSESLRPTATTASFSFVALEASVVCTSVPSDKSAKTDSVLSEGDLEVTKFNLDVRPLAPLRSAVAPLSVPDRVTSAVPKRVKKPATARKSRCTRKKLGTGGGMINLTVAFALSSLNKPASFFVQ